MIWLQHAGAHFLRSWVSSFTASQLVVPDDQVGVAVVDLRQVRGLVLVEVSSPPLDVASAPHQSGHCPLNSLVLGLGVLGGGCLSLLCQGLGL